MVDKDFQIGNRDFKLSKIDVFKQFHIARRMGTILGDVISTAVKLKKGLQVEGQTEEQQLEMTAKLTAPIMQGMSKLSDEDANKVLLGLLEAVEVKQMPAGNWARVARGDVLMIQDFELPELLQAAGRAFMYNIGSFFSIAHQISKEGK